MALPCRIACLRIPRFQIAAHQKAEPELKSKPLVLVGGKGGRAQILLCSREASSRRVCAGMKVSEAKAVCADLLCREYDGKLYARLQAELLEKLVISSPQISSLEPGIFLLDASGLTHLGGESKFCRQVQKMLTLAGFSEMNIGIADTAFAAQVASKFKRSRQYIVPAGKDKEFLAPLSLQHLPVSAEMHETLRRLGIKSIGQFLQIPVDELQMRFGKEGLFAYDLANALDKSKPQLVLEKEVYESSLDLNFPVESLLQTQFIVKSMLENICSRLKENGLLAEELRLSFFSDNDAFHRRPLKLLRASNNARFLLELIRLSLEATPLAREYTGLQISVTESSNESWQQNRMRLVNSLSAASSKQSASARKFKQVEEENKAYATTTLVAESNNNEIQAEPFALLLQKCVTRMGSKSVLRPLSCDQHIPDLAASFLPLAEETGTVLPINIDHANSETRASALACGLVLKKSASPEPVLVEYRGQTPTAITYRGRWHKIKEITEPERLSGLWWEEPVRKSYYAALLEVPSSPTLRGVRQPAGSADPALSCESYLVLLVHDHEKNCWQLDGFFD